MRPKRFLLVTAALSTVACGKQAAQPEPPEAGVMNLPANPKGSFYDAGLEPPPPPPPPTTTQTVIPPPANPKGSHYDAGLTPKK
jgi:hypothetical protein